MRDDKAPVKWEACKFTNVKNGRGRLDVLGEVEAYFWAEAWAQANKLWPGLSKPTKRYPVGRLQMRLPGQPNPKEQGGLRQVVKKKNDAATATATAPAPVAPAPAPVAAAPTPVAQPSVQQVAPTGWPAGMPMPVAQQQNPMAQMMAMMQMMSGFMPGMVPTVDPAAIPFAQPAAPVAPDADKGLDAGIVRPSLIANRIKTQEAVKVGSILDYLCLTADGRNALGGLPKGCTTAFAGPPGKGKSRTALAALAHVAIRGEKVVYVVAEEGFHDARPGRDDLCSRLCKIGMAVTGLDEAAFVKDVLENVFVIEAQYHKGTTWDDFVTKYRTLVERQNVTFAVIDSLNALDPARTKTADNLSALKTYNHDLGITALCLGQIRDTGEAVGGEALAHTADVFFHLEEYSLRSKEIAAQWGGSYNSTVDTLTCKKSVTTPKFEERVRVQRDANGVLVVSPAQPFPLPTLKT